MYLFFAVRACVFEIRAIIKISIFGYEIRNLMKGPKVTYATVKQNIAFQDCIFRSATGLGEPRCLMLKTGHLTPPTAKPTNFIPYMAQAATPPIFHVCISQGSAQVAKRNILF